MASPRIHHFNTERSAHWKWWVERDDRIVQHRSLHDRLPAPRPTPPPRRRVLGGLQADLRPVHSPRPACPPPQSSRVAGGGHWAAARLTPRGQVAGGPRSPPPSPGRRVPALLAPQPPPGASGSFRRAQPSPTKKNVAHPGLTEFFRSCASSSSPSGLSASHTTIIRDHMGKIVGHCG
eukprot:TRINITY_DN10130_c1_g1_i3.p1 TRINITY_DN10130_c1_g1~~TRINITY_DN10130_c1_g1_i3.p1  ORF type:complete len:178 (+),score=35.23 TRINITY_DN10130_c1_g1_i3:96-629(+)